MCVCSIKERIMFHTDTHTHKYLTEDKLPCVCHTHSQDIQEFKSWKKYRIYFFSILFDEFYSGFWFFLFLSTAATTTTPPLFSFLSFFFVSGLFANNNSLCWNGKIHNNNNSWSTNKRLLRKSTHKHNFRQLHIVVVVVVDNQSII